MRRVLAVFTAVIVASVASIGPAAAATAPIDSIADSRVRVAVTLVGLAPDLDGGRLDLSANGQYVLYDRPGRGVGLYDSVRRNTTVLGGDDARPFAVSDGGEAVLYTSGGQPFIWRRSSGESVALPTGGGPITDMGLSQTGAVVVYTERTTGTTGTMRIWTETRVRRFGASVTADPGPVDRDVFVSSNGQRVFFRSGTGIFEVPVVSGSPTRTGLTELTGLSRTGEVQVVVPEPLDRTRFIISSTDGGESQPVEYPPPADPADSAVALAGDGKSVVFAAEQELYRWRTSGALEYLQPPDTVTLGAPRDASITGRFVLTSRRGQNQAILEIVDLDGPTIPIVDVAALTGPQLSDQLRRLYLAYLGREPDPIGLNHWMVTRARGRTVSQVSSAFASSTEFANTYGVLADEQFVDLVYQNVLGRAPDAAGRSYWLSRLAAGMKRGALMTEFSESPEFIARTGTTTPTLPLAHRIDRLYRAYFDRTADQAGLDYWLERFSRGASLSALSNAFAASTEFRNTYGQLDDEQFIDLVYRNVLGREPDEPGKAYWLDRLVTGKSSRGQVMTGFSESPEFVVATDTIPPSG